MRCVKIDAGNLGPSPVPAAPTRPSLDANSPEAAARALLQHVGSSGLPYPPALPDEDPESAMGKHTAEAVQEPDMRQCFQIVDGQLVSVPLQLVLPKPKPKGAMKRQGVPAGDAGGMAGIEASRPSFLMRCASKLRLKILGSPKQGTPSSVSPDIQLT